MAEITTDDPRIQHLYEVDRADFVAARTALAKEVGKDDKEAARGIKALRKPTVAAWALNRAARAHPADVDALFRTGAAVRRAQERALGGDRGDLRDSVDERRAVVRRLTDEAVALSSDTHRDEIDATLEAASIDAEVGDLLRRGQLTNTVARPSGFDVLAGMDLAAAPPRRVTPDDDTDDDADDDAARDAQRAARAELQRRLGEADDAVGRSQDVLERAERALAEAEREVGEARAAVQRDVAARDAIRAELAD